MGKFSKFNLLCGCCVLLFFLAFLSLCAPGCADVLVNDRFTDT